MLEKSDDLDIRVIALLNLLSYRVERDILPNIVCRIREVIGKNVSETEKHVILGKLVAFTVYTGSQTILSKFKDDREKADEFNAKLFLCFLKKFGEAKETLLDFERDNPAMGEAQPIWSLGSQISKSLGLEDFILAVSVGSFSPQLSEIELESTKYCIETPLSELKA